ncbi:MAG: hypothetical protein WA020_10125 [Candidatus Acidiferrales bacterium]
MKPQGIPDGPVPIGLKNPVFFAKALSGEQLTPNGFDLNGQNSLYFSLLAGNWARRKVRARLHPRIDRAVAKRNELIGRNVDAHPAGMSGAQRAL